MSLFYRDGKLFCAVFFSCKKLTVASYKKIKEICKVEETGVDKSIIILIFKRLVHL